MLTFEMTSTFCKASRHRQLDVHRQAQLHLSNPAHANRNNHRRPLVDRIPDMIDAPAGFVTIGSAATRYRPIHSRLRRGAALAAATASTPDPMLDFALLGVHPDGTPAPTRAERTRSASVLRGAQRAEHLRARDRPRDDQLDGLGGTGLSVTSIKSSMSATTARRATRSPPMMVAASRPVDVAASTWRLLDQRR